MVHYLKDKLYLLDPISLDEMVECRLLNRIDTKYICNIKRLAKLIELAEKDFRIQASNDDRIFGYESLYFDTPGMKTYFDHHQGRRIRYKVRFRKYLDTGDAFLEVKKKKNYIRTDKRRTQFEFSSSLDQQHEEFLSNHIKIPENGLEPTIWTLFDRITLAGKKHLERVTIDTNLRFKNENREISMPGLSIIEVKREKAGGLSPFTQILRELNIRPYGISKYIMGNVLLNPNLKHNRFLKKIVTVNKICYDT